MQHVIGPIVNKALSIAGLKIVAADRAVNFPTEFDDDDIAIFEYIRANRLSMVSDPRLFATALACKHVCDRGVPGDFVECGVYRGGNAIMAADVFRRIGGDRRIFLYDTFTGMTEPTELDTRLRDGSSTLAQYQERNRGQYTDWVFCPIEEVQQNFRKRGLLTDKVVFVKGDVMETLEVSANLPNRISVLRLDTDWYKSTKKEMEVLYSRLQVGGVLLLDDYGHFAGAKKAVDEFFGAEKPFLHVVDYTGRAAVKTA